MNIFALADDPRLAAKWQHDKHVVKMTLETAQMLSAGVILNLKFRYAYGYERVTDDFYGLTHHNHPSARWGRSNLANFKWLAQHGVALSDEYTHRFGRVHGSQDVIFRANDLAERLEDDGSTLTPFAQAMPVQYKDDDSVLAYRLYYLGEKVLPDSTWTNRDRARDLPGWLSRKVLALS